MYKFIFVILSDSKRELTSWVNIAYLVSALRQINDLEVEVCRFSLYNIEEAVDTIIDRHPDFLGFSMFQSNYSTCLEFARKIKERNILVKTILGNIEATFYANHIMNNYEQIDFIIKGEGETTIKELCECIIGKFGVANCKGVLYRDKHGYYETKDRDILCDIDILGIPDRSFMKQYKSNEFSVIGSRGCNGCCTFCDVNTINNRRSLIRYRKIDAIIEEIKILVKEYNCIHINFIDPIFLGGNFEKITEFYNQLIKEKLSLTFRINLTCNLISVEMVDLLLKLREIGLELVFLGFEAGNHEDLKLYAKKAKLEDNRNAIVRLYNAKIVYQYGLINFNPYSSKNTLWDTGRFLQKNYMITDLSILTQSLCIYGGAPILKKIKLDNLTTQLLDEPITNVMNYSFKYPEIQVIREILIKAWGEMNINYIILHDILLYERYERFVTKNSDLKEQIFSLAKLISEHSLSIYFKVLLIYKNEGCDLYCKVEKDVEIAKNEISLERSKIEKDIRKMAIELHRKGQLVFHNG